MKKKFTVKDVAIIGICSAILLVAQVSINFIPNVELVSLLIILYTQFFGARTLAVIYIFALLEGVLYGFGLWWVMYLYVWTILYAVARPLRDMDSSLGWAVVSGLFGLCFGALCSIPYFFLMGFAGGVAWFINGLLFDLVHCAGNFIVALLLYKPLRLTLQKI